MQLQTIKIENGELTIPQHFLLVEDVFATSNKCKHALLIYSPGDDSCPSFVIPSDRYASGVDFAEEKTLYEACVRKSPSFQEKVDAQMQADILGETPVLLIENVPASDAPWTDNPLPLKDCFIQRNLM